MYQAIDDLLCSPKESCKKGDFWVVTQDTYYLLWNQDGMISLDSKIIEYQKREFLKGYLR